MRHVCGDVELVKALAEWLGDLLAARSGATEHVLTALLALVGRMPLKGPMLKQVRGRVFWAVLCAQLALAAD